MNVVWRMFAKELLSYFVSAIAYVILFVFLLVNGVTFYFYLSASGGNLEAIVSHQYGFLPFWFLAILIPPLITMRCFAEERRTGTYELLLDPVREDVAWFSEHDGYAYCSATVEVVPAAQARAE